MLEFAPSFEELDPILLRLLNSGNRRVIVYNRDFVQAVFNYNCSLYGLPPLGLVTAAHKAKLDPKYNPATLTTSTLGIFTNKLS